MSFQYLNVRACRRLKSLSRPPRLRGNQTFSTNAIPARMIPVQVATSRSTIAHSDLR